MVVGDIDDGIDNHVDDEHQSGVNLGGGYYLGGDGVGGKMLILKFRLEGLNKIIALS